MKRGALSAAAGQHVNTSSPASSPAHGLQPPVHSVSTTPTAPGRAAHQLATARGPPGPVVPMISRSPHRRGRRPGRCPGHGMPPPSCTGMSRRRRISRTARFARSSREGGRPGTHKQVGAGGGPPPPAQWRAMPRGSPAEDTVTWSATPAQAHATCVLESTAGKQSQAQLLSPAATPSLASSPAWPAGPRGPGTSRRPRKF
jgi:hypothetical protein